MNHIIELLSGVIAGLLAGTSLLITTGVEQYGYIAVFVLMTLESALIPIPSEVTMPFAGFMASQGKLDLWIVIIVGALANLFGSLIVYYLGRWAGPVVIHSLVRKYGKYVLITIDEVETSERWFREHGEIIAFFSRVLPVVRTFISLPAGMSKMDVKKFSIYSFAGALIWSSILTYIGYVLGQNWHSLEKYFRQFQYVIVGVVVGLAVWYVWHKVKKIRG